MVKVILNEQHKLLPAQVSLLNEKFGYNSWEILTVPADGWNKAQIESEAFYLRECEDITVFASPIPLLVAKMAFYRGMDSVIYPYDCIGVFIFHNDSRVAKEVPDGKGGSRVIHVVAPEGWQLIEV